MNLFSGVSQFSHDLDFYTLVITLVCGLVTLGILSFIGYFCFKYHASKVMRAEKFESSKLEISWTLITLAIFMVFFFWATFLYERQVTPVKADYQIFVYAKRWMWKFHHQNGFVEVNNVHVPQGKNVNFIMISQDVIHSLYFPDFRIKQDVLPEMYSVMNLHALKSGEFPLFCTEYCGTDHSLMKGKMKIVDEATYLESTRVIEKNPVSGKDLFIKHDCLSCHHAGSETAPSLVGIYSEKKNDDYIRRAIFYPKKEMPAYKDQLSEENVRHLIEYIKTMKASDENIL